MTNQPCPVLYFILPYLYSIPIFKDRTEQHEDQQSYKQTKKTIIHRCNNCNTSKYGLPVGLIMTIVLVEMGDSVKILLFLCQVEISRRVTLEELPPVLVLHLKRFVYEKTGGCQKLIKNIEYPVDLEISKGEFCEQSSCFVCCFGVAF